MATVPDLRAAVARAERHAPHLRWLLGRHPDIPDALAADPSPVDEPIDADLPVARALRVARQRTALRLALLDLAGLAPLETVVAGLSDLADRTLDHAITAAIAERTPGVEPQGFVAVALGKHGSRELNYSSDIDPILLFDPATLPRRAREEPGDAAVRIARRVVELMQARDADGFVFRVDLRLRPSSEVTPIAIPVAAAISHYESSALGWERAAFIRARAAAGDVGLGRRFLAAIRPFVWRTALDFGAIEEMRGLSHRIREVGRDAPFGPGFDLKRGRGGIRDVEFFAQILQLIHGGRDRTLRAPATLDALAALAKASHVGEGEATLLADAYRLYRTVEHRLQMIDDRQTHVIPEGAALDAVAGLHGLDDGPALLERLAQPVARVGSLCDTLDHGETEAALPASDALSTLMADKGFADPVHAAATVARWRAGGPRSLRSPAARSALETILPGLIDALAAAPDPMVALARADKAIERFPSAVNIFRLLEARPALSALLATIFSQAPTLADLIGRRPQLLDGLIDTTALAPAPTIADLVATFRGLDPAEPLEVLFDRIRREVRERRFSLGTQIVAAAADPLKVSAGYARVAEAALVVLADAVVADHQRQHGRTDGELVVVALGRLGGEALTHASDLDLVYLFTGTPGGESDGARPLDTTRYFNRLAQRVTAALSVPTAAGPLYPVDTRLRPSGAQGLLAVSVESFARYQAEAAWTWEAMALTRARVVYGSPDARAAVDAVIAQALRRPRDPIGLRRDVAAMRAEMAAHKPPAGPFDVKLGEGGLVDLEFVVHHAQLASGIGLTPRLDLAIAELAGAGLIDPGFVDAYAVLARLLVVLRLVSPDAEPATPAARALVAQACGDADWPGLLAHHRSARQTVCSAWQALAKEDR